MRNTWGESEREIDQHTHKIPALRNSREDIRGRAVSWTFDITDVRPTFAVNGRDSTSTYVERRLKSPPDLRHNQGRTSQYDSPFSNTVPVPKVCMRKGSASSRNGNLSLTIHGKRLGPCESRRLRFLLLRTHKSGDRTPIQNQREPTRWKVGDRLFTNPPTFQQAGM